MVRGQSRLVHRLVGVLERDRLRLPYMQMNAYDERIVLRDIEASGALAIGRFATVHGDTAGAVLVIRKLSASI